MESPKPEVLNATQLAELLGISRAGAYNLLNRADFPTLCIGGRKLVVRTHLLDWMNSQVAEGGNSSA